MKTAFFRTDASSLIGTGHVMRCLTLADSLREHGVDSIFVCRRLSGHLGEYIRTKGYSVEWIESKNDEFRPEEDSISTKAILEKAAQPVDWLIVDHYGIDCMWEAKVGPLAGRLLVIDDLANRPHECDILVDQNAYDRMETRYVELVLPRCVQLLGPRYLLLRPAFYEARRSLRTRDGIVKRLLVFFGGSDPTNETAKALRALAQWPGDDPPFHTEVVVGSSNPFRQEIASLCARIPHTTLHVQAENMAELISQADYALGAGGVAMWERCYLGLPSAVTVAADNQGASVRYAAEQGAVAYVGDSPDSNETVYTEAIRLALESPQALTEMARKAFNLTASDPLRKESPVVAAMMQMMNEDTTS